MLTPERLNALTAVRDGTVTARKLNSPGSPILFEPREMTVCLGYLQKAQLVTTESTQRPYRLGVEVTVFLTKEGERIVSQLSA